MKRTTLLLAVLASAAGCAAHSGAGPLEPMSRFRLNQFVTGAWTIGNDYSDAYAARFAAAGLTAMVDAPTALDPAARHGYSVLITTMLHPVFEDQVLVPGRYTVGPYAHVADLKWLHEHFGGHKALAGYLLNDTSGVPVYTGDCAAWLATTAPAMLPLAVTNPQAVTAVELQASADALAALPVLAVRNDVFAEHNDWDETRKVDSFCARLDADRLAANAAGRCLWPVVGVLGQPELGPSQVRFASYASIAYGAQGIFYSSFSRNPVWSEKGTVFSAVHDVAQHIQSIVGPRVLGLRSHTVFSSAGAAKRPAPGELIEKMDSSLLAGVLVPDKNFKGDKPLPAYVMLVDTRTANDSAAEPPARTVSVTFGPAVKTVEILRRTGAGGAVTDHTLTVELKAGDGVFLRLAD